MSLKDNYFDIPKSQIITEVMRQVAVRKPEVDLDSRDVFWEAEFLLCNSK